MTDSDLSRFRQVAAGDRFLCVVSTVRADGTVQSSVVNAGVLDAAESPTGTAVVAFVAHGGTYKLANLRARPAITVLARAGLRWASVEGDAALCGFDDPYPGVDGEGLRLLLRAIYVAAGGVHDDWDTYDRVIAKDRRAAVLVTPRRVVHDPGVDRTAVGNPG